MYIFEGHKDPKYLPYYLLEMKANVRQIREYYVIHMFDNGSEGRDDDGWNEQPAFTHLARYLGHDNGVSKRDSLGGGYEYKDSV